MLTVNTILKSLSLELTETHRRYLGNHLRNRFKEATGLFPERVQEDTYMVLTYPDTFFDDAKATVEKYIKKYLPHRHATIPGVSIQNAGQSKYELVKPTESEWKNNKPAPAPPQIRRDRFSPAELTKNAKSKKA